MVGQQGRYSMREMIDCTSANLNKVAAVFPHEQMWGAYMTGTPDVKYTIAQLTQIPAPVTVTIDQGYGSPAITTANVRDVENFAWSPAAAVKLANWNNPRPTIYCNLNDLTRSGGVLDSGWAGDIWLAHPAVNAPLIPPSIPGLDPKRIVAIQWQFNDTYDKSVVFDDYWPERKPMTAHPVAPAPPGQWEKSAVLTGIGLDGNLWQTTYDPDTGLWSHPVRLP